MGISKLAIIGLFAGVLSPVNAWAVENCGKNKTIPTKIHIELELPDAVYDLGKSLRQINEGHTADDWLERHGMQKVWKSSDMARLGYAEGGSALITSARFEAKPYDKYGVYYCPYITRLDVAMMLRTRIVIPNDFKKGGCRFNTIHEHEYRHYLANRDVAEEFVRRLYKDLPVIIGELESRWPYVEGKHAYKAMDELKEGVKTAIEAYIYQAMSEDLTRRNDLIDTPEEYASSGPKMKACPD